MKLFIALDAFSQVLTHPLLSEHVWPRGEEVFSKYGWDLINKGKIKIKDLVEINTRDGTPLEEFLDMDNPNYKR